MAKKKEAQTTGKTQANRAAKVHKEAERLRVSRDILALTACVLAAVLIALSVRTFGFSMMVVRSDAMQGTLQRGDIVLISRAAQPEAGNIVLAAARNGNVLRRVAGEPGDTVSAAHGEVFRNGMELYEPYAQGEMLWQIAGQRLEDNVYLLLPDNRAYDSALIQSGGISGVVRAVIWPPSRAGFF